MEENPI